MSYEKYLRANMRQIGGARWDELIRQIAGDFATIGERTTIQDKLADALLARGLSVIEDLVSPIALSAQDRVDQIDALITEGTESVNNAVATANAASDGIAELLAQLQGEGLSADLVIETVARIFLTPSLKATYDGYAAAIAAKASPADIAAAIADLKGGVGPAFDTLVEIATKLGDDDTAIAGILTSLGNRVRVDTAAQGLNGTQQGNALTNLGATTLGKSLIAIADAAALRTAAGLGSAATKAFGLSVGNLVEVQTGGKLPALDGSDLTGLSGGFISEVYYTSSQTIPIPAGATKAFVEMVAAGGSSGSAHSSISGVAGGEGSSLRKLLIGLTPANTIIYTQGAPGAAPGNGSLAAGADAGNSTLASGTQSISTLTVYGGKGAVAGNNWPLHFAGWGRTATPLGGDVNIAGRKMQVTSDGSTVTGYPDAPCSEDWGVGGAVLSAQGVGSQGTGYGWGGGPSLTTGSNFAGCIGGPGCLRIRWFK